MTPRQLKTLKVDNGDIVLPNGKRYRIFVYSTSSDDRIEALQQLERLIKEGATVIGQKPKYAPSLQDHFEGDIVFDDLVNRLWSGLERKDPYIEVARYKESCFVNFGGGIFLLSPKVSLMN